MLNCSLIATLYTSICSFFRANFRNDVDS